jgi:hypothetical protein
LNSLYFWTGKRPFDAFEQHGMGAIHTRAAGKNPRIVAEGDPAKDRRGRTVDAKLASACYGSDSAIDSLRDRRLSPIKRIGQFIVFEPKPPTGSSADN